MQFVKTEDLKTGMRLARPIYSKKGVLLYDRNSKLSPMAIDSVRNFGLLGIYVLEPAEPLPPMSEEDKEFERFQTMVIFSIQEALTKILENQKQNKIQVVANMIIKNYGHIDSKINFYQNLRSRDDYVYRHSLNVAILCGLMTHRLNCRVDEQLNIIQAAIMHDIGKLKVDGDIVYRDDCSDAEKDMLYQAQVKSGGIIEASFAEGLNIKRICMQAARQEHDASQPIDKMSLGARILAVANKYDEMTAMSLGGERKSEVMALYALMERPDKYEPKIVKALTDSINILFPGVSVELNTGEKALVLVENPLDILRPTVLSFKDNSIIDLQLKINSDIKVVDIMKTLDNRYIFDPATLQAAGIQVNNI